ncbi:hypothetical protein BFI50_14050 [Yersinia pestis subsp. microtus bv. Xilingolensis]|nr:hypothetical protein BFI50_14050 [Yersinia pestis subsp. microtus bv. Xilingolensis]OVY80040.1 hypothetical protein BFI51_14660 [Yersinia pestis subsp. microtus bv. Xilingolensis]
MKTITLVLAIFDLIRYRSHRLSISWAIDLMGYRSHGLSISWVIGLISYYLRPLSALIFAVATSSNMFDSRHRSQKARPQ